jgi:iron complex transport system substrate-binding protein
MRSSSSYPTLRIVSLAPSATSILCAIGGKKHLVAVTKWCADVASVDGLPKLGDCWHMDSVDEIMKLKPSLVIGSVPYKQETLAKLLEHPLTFLATNPRTLADIDNDIRILGGIANRIPQAERLIRKMRQEFSAITRKTRTAKRKLRVYCEAWPNPRISSPPWVAEIVKICGSQMVLPAGQKVSDEQVAQARPDLIVLAWAATGGQAKVEKAYTVAAWKNLPAIRNKRVFVVRDELLNTPGPPLLTGAKRLFRIFQEAAVQESKE